jgi:hypothetical protein
MNETTKVNIDMKLEELSKYLKIDTSEHDCRDQFEKELKGARLSHKIYRAFGIILMAGAGLLLIITFIAKGETILGIQIKDNYFYYFMVFIMISNLFIFGGKAELKADRLKTFKLLHDLDKE